MPTFILPLHHAFLLVSRGFLPSPQPRQDRPTTNSQHYPSPTQTYKSVTSKKRTQGSKGTTQRNQSTALLHLKQPLWSPSSWSPPPDPTAVTTRKGRLSVRDLQIRATRCKFRSRQQSLHQGAKREGVTSYIQVELCPHPDPR